MIATAYDAGEKSTVKARRSDYGITSTGVKAKGVLLQ